MKDLGERPKRRKARPGKAKPELLFYVEGPTFVVYDARFLEEQDDKYIYGYGFFRDARVGTFLFTIDYDRKYRKLVTSVALQMARDAGDLIYDGEGYGDVLELSGLQDVERDGDYVRLTKDKMDLGLLSRFERRARSRVDRYGEILTLLLEMAESKW